MINFFNEDFSFQLKQKRKIRSWIVQIAQKEGFKIDSLNYIFCSDAYLIEINKSYLNHDTYTDIVTFGEAIEGDISGDIFISIERINENAKSFNTNFYAELYRVMAHGILHLCGYKDKQKADKALMTQKENEALEMII